MSKIYDDIRLSRLYTKHLEEKMIIWKKIGGGTSS